MQHNDARALIVEDDHSWQQILSEILTDAGLAVDVAESLEGAEPVMRTTPHRLAVLDLALSGSDHHNRDGLRLLDDVRRVDPGCITILLTGFATVEIAVSALTEHGAFTCLRKDTFSRSQFRELVSRALADSLPPASPGAAGSLMALPGQGGAAGQEMEPALVAEDDAGWRSILGELLSDSGYQPRLCSSFGEALGCLRREKYGLAVIDLLLPGVSLRRIDDEDLPVQAMDGYRLLASTRAGGIPTIVVSGAGTSADIEQAYAEQGIFAYLEKQAFDRRVFLQTVAEARKASQAEGELGDLTQRQRDVLQLLAHGLTNKEIAEALVITTHTVKRHLKSIFEKLDIHTRSAAAAKAVSGGIASDSTAFGKG
jgi:DNA-binding NarL/FixJ family response regulator